ncbi:MAG: peptide ABC transporter substrate-binding protein [Candidatus Buchananbacteria bacterium]|nr:peptide ABC transporter substrate-binding protein [Candidatus Buchananbacteria bacterium]
MNLKNSQLKKNLDKKLIHSLNGFKLPKLKQFKYVLKVLTKKEKRIFLTASLLIIVSTIFIGFAFYQQNFIPKPTGGGEYTEGLIGAPQYINPILSQTNDVDSDISHLIFSGLMRYDQNLQLVGDLADSWTVNDNQTEYTFTLKDNLRWQNGQPLTADDVVFTVHSIQEPDFKSPLLVSLRGVEVTEIDQKTIQFKLSDPYPDFLEVMTFGILPEHIWQEIPAINANLTEYNLKPIGSGAWQFKSLTKDKLGNVKSYALEPNQNYYGQKPYLQKITFKFYPDFPTAIAALNNHSTDGISFLPKEDKKKLVGQKNLQLYSFALPQYTAIFFNQKQNEFLTNQSVRQALQLVINRPEILTEALQLEGAIIDGPKLPKINESSQPQINFDPSKAASLLTEAGWEKITAEQYSQFLADQKQKEQAPTATSTEDLNQNKTESTSTPTTAENTNPPEKTQDFYLKKGEQILEITLTTVNQPENTIAATLVKQAWENIGVKVNLQIVEPGRISREIIKPRNYQALLFGIIVGSNPDPYPFWHSSQVQDPGLNLAAFSNRNADKLLEDARAATDESIKKDKYQQFQDILNQNIPAIFLYNPTYTYVVDKKIKGIDINRIIGPADRFNNLENWYIKTNRVYRPN